MCTYVVCVYVCVCVCVCVCVHVCKQTCQAFLAKNRDMHATNTWFKQRMHERFVVRGSVRSTYSDKWVNLRWYMYLKFMHKAA